MDNPVDSTGKNKSMTAEDQNHLWEEVWGYMCTYS